MKYSMKEVAEMLNIPPSTIRYYDKEGLFPFIQRKESGYRIFTDAEVSMLELIECFKNTGMPIKDIKVFSDWIILGDETLQQRYNLFAERKVIVEEQMRELQKSLDLINHKCEYYQTAIEAGTESIHKKEQT